MVFGFVSLIFFKSTVNILILCLCIEFQTVVAVSMAHFKGLGFCGSGLTADGGGPQSFERLLL